MNPAEIVREFAGLAAEPGGPAARAEALLAQLRRVLRFDAGEISLLAPEQGAHAALARAGYDARVCGYLDGPGRLADLELVGLRRSRRPLRLRDLPVPPEELAGWAEYLVPAGFRDGVGAGLFTPQGDYLGVLALHTAAAEQISVPARELLGLLATPIAAGVDPWRSLARIAGLVDSATAGIVLTPAGEVRPLPGLPDHALLAAGSGVLTGATAQLADGDSHVSFLAPLPEAAGEPGGTHARITALAAPPEVRRFAAAVVLAGPAGDLHGLSAQELQVLGVLVTGASNERIGVALGITTRTVEAHVEHVRAKLAGRSRTAAAARALRLGLFVPPSMCVRRAARAPHGRPPA